MGASKMPALKDLSGQTFGRLVAISRILPDRSGQKAKWRCKCSCGVTADIVITHLTTGKTNSCGCLRQEVTSGRATIHGKNNTPEYSAYQNAKNRCQRPEDVRYHRYGGRGIQFNFSCFQEFYDDIGPRPSKKHSLDRKDTNGHYELGNVSWSTSKDQMRNTSTNRHLTFDGRTQSLAGWCEEYRLPYKTVFARIKNGWNTSDALTKPIQGSGR